MLRKSLLLLFFALFFIFIFTTACTNNEDTLSNVDGYLVLENKYSQFSED